MGNHCRTVPTAFRTGREKRTFQIQALPKTENFSSIYFCSQTIYWNGKKLSLKVHKHENFFFTFFAETETLWSQGLVTRDF
jgi:hypothetical protein